MFRWIRVILRWKVASFILGEEETVQNSTVDTLGQMSARVNLGFGGYLD